MDQHDAPAPLFIVGAPRSGTSLLYKALCLHPAASYISNWVQRFPRVPQLAALNRAAQLLPRMQRAAWFGADGNAYVYGGHRPWVVRAFPMPAEGESMYAQCGIPRFPPDSPGTERHRQQTALRSAFAEIERHGGGRFLVNKRIANNHRIALLRESFPAARFVEIIRDGRAVAYSLSKVGWWPDSLVPWYGGTPRQWEEAGGDPWEITARDWVEEVRAVEQGLTAVPPESVLSIRYERLVQDLVPVLRELASFAGLPADRRWVKRIDQLPSPRTSETWRERLTAREIATIERFQSHTLRRRGYDVR